MSRTESLMCSWRGLRNGVAYPQMHSLSTRGSHWPRRGFGHLPVSALELDTRRSRRRRRRRHSPAHGPLFGSGPSTQLECICVSKLRSGIFRGINERSFSSSLHGLVDAHATHATSTHEHKSSSFCNPPTRCPHQSHAPVVEPHAQSPLSKRWGTRRNATLPTCAPTRTGGL